MLNIQQKAQCVLGYHKLKSPIAVQCKFRNEFGQNPLHTNSIKRWFTWHKIEYCLDILRATNGAHVQIYK